MTDASHDALIRDQFTRQAAVFNTAAPIRNENALRAIVEAASPNPGDEAKIVEMFRASARDDGLGIEVRLDGEAIHYAYPVAILAAVRP